MHLKIKFTMNSQKRKQAFTLVELIVVITILAILWTIGFISLQWYSKDSRNTVRLTDAKLIKKALWIYITTNSKYPDPEEFLNVTYSGSTLWKQWSFGWNPYRKLWTLSNIPVDPLLWVEYDYSVMSNWSKYQLWTIMEWWLLSYNENNLLNKTHALSTNDIVSYISGDYFYNDIYINTWSTCYNIASPSLIINDLWNNWALSVWTSYNFVYNWWVNIPNSYSWSIDITATWSTFKISEVYNKCTIDNLTDIDTYVTNLSSTYQQYDWIKEYESIIYNSDTLAFQLSSILKLKDDWLIIADNIISDLKAIAPDYEFSDSFTGSSTNILSHTVNWSSTKGTSDYYVNNDELNRNSWTTEIIFPSPSPIISSSDTKTSFVIKDISNWDINIYAKYIDSDNYYMLKINSAWYDIIQNKNTNVDIITSITQNITSWDIIEFNVSNNVLKFLFNGIEKDRVVADILTWLWKPWIEISSIWDRIDDYKLYYR